jgi:hypothetical protein
MMASLRSYVREGLSGNAVTDGVDARYICLVEFVDNDLSFFGLDAGFLETDAFDVRLDTHGAQQNVGFELYFAALGFDGRHDAITRRVDFGHFAIGHNVDAFFLEAFFELFGDVGVFQRNDSGRNSTMVTFVPMLL